MNKIKIVFQPEGKKVYVPPGITVAAAAAEAGVSIDIPCGAVGKCGKCKVEITSGCLPPDYVEQELLSKDDLNKGIRLACRTKITGNTVVSVPRSSRLQTQKILDVGIQTQVYLKPAIRKIYLTIDPDNQQDIKEKLKLYVKGHLTLEPFFDTIKKTKGAITLILYGEELIGIEAGNTTNELYGLAFDIGTTTVVGTLVDLNTGLVKATAADMNAQLIYGDDVVSRLNFCIQNKNGLKDLNHKIVQVINKIIAEVCEDANIMPDKIYDAVFAGNTTMEHLLLKVDPVSLATYPFRSKLNNNITKAKAKDLKININKKSYVEVFPVIGGWVGGDTVSVILATNLHKTEHIKLAIDIGTNGEVILGNKDKLLATSCAAGPAFEGAHIKFGMRASKGAIEKIDVIDGNIVYKTIEDAPAVGFCGSGLIDAMAVLVGNDIVDETGRIKSPDELKGTISENLISNIKVKEDGNEFIFVKTERKEISLNQKDIREIQLAKGAILTGITILMKELGVTKENIKEVLMAGAFGNYIRPDNALAIGLIPSLEKEKIIFCGNAAEEGARKSLVSIDLKNEAEEIASTVKHIELGANPDFQDEFANSMLFPAKSVVKT